MLRMLSFWRKPESMLKRSGLLKIGVFFKMDTAYAGMTYDINTPRPLAAGIFILKLSRLFEEKLGRVYGVNTQY